MTPKCISYFKIIQQEKQEEEKRQEKRNDGSGQVTYKLSLDSHLNNMLFSEVVLGPVSSEPQSSSVNANSSLPDPLSYGSGSQFLSEFMSQSCHPTPRQRNPPLIIYERGELNSDEIKSTQKFVAKSPVVDQAERKSEILERGRLGADYKRQFKSHSEKNIRRLDDEEAAAAG